MRELILTKGFTTIVDYDIYEIYKNIKYQANLSGDKYYAVHSAFINDKYHKLMLHKQILGIQGTKTQGDHIDGNSLNNLRSNLRISTCSQNNANVKSHKNSTSKYLGVSWSKLNDKWKVQIKKDGKVKHIGLFESEVEAAFAYNEAAKIEHGKFANLNIVTHPQED